MKWWNTERDFKSISDELYELLHDKVFVAHNVNFDYSFVKHHLQQAGYELNCKKICTIRLGKANNSRFKRLWTGKDL